MRLMLCALLLAALPAWTQAPVPEEPATGQALADQIRNAVPDETNTVQGTLIIRAGGKTTNVPVVCRVAINGDAWETVYDVVSTNNSSAERLIVIHHTNAANEYLYARASGPSVPLPKPEGISAAQAAATPLGGSDFSAADLGMDFLHWPQQTKLKGEMRLDHPCYVLESRDPAARVIVRVKSWIEKESNAPLVAQGFDARDRKVKEFSLHGSSFKKVNGHWRLENMDIHDYRKGSRTELKFDILDK